MDVLDLKRKEAAEAKDTVLIFNPLKRDVPYTYGGVPGVIKQGENERFSKGKSQVVGQLLVDLYLNTKDNSYDVEQAKKLVFP